MKSSFSMLLGVSLFAISAPALAQTTGAQTGGQDVTPSQPSGAEAPAQAAPAAAANSGGGLEDIVVTAQRRSENLQNVPISVAAVTGGQLQQSGVRGITDLKLAVPNLNLTDSNGYLTSSLRGVGTNAVGLGVENPVALYVDGVYYGSPAAASLVSLNNIAQVEVLKGPQGTLFGRNATGGLIQVSTKTPTSAPEAEFNLSYGNYETVNVNAYVAGGIGNILAADVAVQYGTQGRGFGVNRTTGADTYKVDHDFAVRSKWVLTPADGTKFTLIGDYVDSKNTNSAFRTMPGTINGFDPSRGREPDYGYDAVSDYTSFLTNKGGGASLRWDQELGAISLTSTTAYRNVKTEQRFDYDGINRQLNTFLVSQRDKQFSQELQLTSKSNSRFTWVLGGYYFNATASCIPFEGQFYDQGAIVDIRNKQRTRSLAGYAQGTYEIFNDTHLTLGGRYTSEKRSINDTQLDTYVIPLNLQLPTTVVPGQSATFNKFTFRASLDHRFNEQVLVYASFNRGFKSGGFNQGVPGSAPYRPETLDAYEAGIKTDLLDRHLRINVSGFYYDYSDIQVQLLNQGGIAVQNGASARLYGIDADFQAIITQQFRLSGGIGWTHPKFESYPGCQVSTPLGGTPVTVGSCAGNQLPLASRVLANLNADYKFDFAGGELNLNTNAYYNSGFYTESDNVYRQPKYVQLGANVKWTAPGGNLSVSAYGKNLTNQRVINFETTIPNGTHTGFWQAPRTYGVSLGYKF